MEGFLLASLVHHANLLLGLSLAAVVILRKSIRKRHILALLIITAACFIAFFALLLLGVSGHLGSIPATAFQSLLGILAGMAVCCGSAIGFSLVLKSVGLAALDDAQAQGSTRRR